MTLLLTIIACWAFAVTLVAGLCVAASRGDRYADAGRRATAPSCEEPSRVRPAHRAGSRGRSPRRRHDAGRLAA